MAYQSKYKGKQVDEAVSQAIDKLPVRMTEAEDSIAALEKHKADVGSVPKKLSQLTDDVGLGTTKQDVSELQDKVKELNDAIEDIPSGGGGGGDGNGAILVSIHDDLASIIPEDGQMYIVKDDSMETSDTIRYYMMIGNGETSLADLPVVAEDLSLYSKKNHTHAEIDVLNDQMGDVSEALDAIIAMQTEAIGEGGV